MVKVRTLVLFLTLEEMLLINLDDQNFILFLQNFSKWNNFRIKKTYPPNDRFQNNYRSLWGRIESDTTEAT